MFKHFRIFIVFVFLTLFLAAGYSGRTTAFSSESSVYGESEPLSWVREFYTGDLRAHLHLPLLDESNEGEAAAGMGVSGAAGWYVPTELKWNARNLLEGLIPTGDRHLDKEIERAVKHIEKSLDAKLWEDDTHLVCKHGKKVFDEEKKAVKELMKKKKKFQQELVEYFNMAINDLVDADMILAQTLIDEARSFIGVKEKEIEKAEKEMSKAQNEREKGKYDKAIDHYKKAWKHACKAIGKAVGPVEVILDEGGISGSGLVMPEEGGTIEAVASDGTRFILEIPEDALLGQEAVTVTVTPILDIEGLPENGNFIAGVRLEPDGLHLFKCAILTIEMPILPDPDDLFAICFNGPDGEFYCPPLYSVDVETSSITFHIMHFSDWVAWTAKHCPELESPMFTEDIYKHAIACMLKLSGGKITDKNIIEIRSVFHDWFYELVYPILTTTTQLDQLDLAITKFCQWWRHLQLLGLESSFEIQIQTGREEILRVFVTELNRLNDECNSSDDWCEKKEKLYEFLQWLKKALVLFDDSELSEIPGMEEYCDGVLERFVDKVVIVSDGDVVDSCEEIKLTAFLKDLFGAQIFNSEVGWDSSDNSVAKIQEVYFDENGVNTVKIKGLSPGKAIITVRALEGCDAEDSVTIEVINEVVSVEVNPQGESICVDDTLQLEATVKDCEGNTLTEKTVTWSSDNPGVAAVDQTTGLVTGVAAGSATITATCEEKSGTTTVTVSECVPAGADYLITWVATISGYREEHRESERWISDQTTESEGTWEGSAYIDYDAAGGQKVLSFSTSGNIHYRFTSDYYEKWYCADGSLYYAYKFIDRTLTVIGGFEELKNQMESWFSVYKKDGWPYVRLAPFECPYYFCEYKLLASDVIVHKEWAGCGSPVYKDLSSSGETSFWSWFTMEYYDYPDNHIPADNMEGTSFSYSKTLTIPYSTWTWNIKVVKLNSP